MPRKKKKQKGKGIYDKVANTLFGANLKDGEIHAPVWTKDGLKFGSYIGPGTDLVSRLKSGAEPVSESDRVAQAHDIRYGKAKNASDVRAADLRMVKKLDELQKNKKDYLFNIYMGKLPIKIKMLAEDLGVIKKGSFSDMKGESNATADAKLKELDQKGYGKKKKKSAWHTHVASVRKKKGCSYKDALKLASATYNKK